MTYRSLSVAVRTLWGLPVQFVENQVPGVVTARRSLRPGINFYFLANKGSVIGSGTELHVFRH